MLKNGQKYKGFTLIELLVVIAIISLLASVALVAFNSAREKAKTAKTKADMAQFTKLIQIAQGNSGTFMQITGSGCSACDGSCWNSPPWNGGDLRNVPTTNACYIAWMNVISKVNAAAGNIMANSGPIQRDAWGSPYVVDENEREFPADPCRADSYCSAGSDGISGTSDDICLEIPFATPCP